MTEQKKPNLTAADRHNIIEEITKNTKITRKELAEKTGINSRNLETELVQPWIKENAQLVFGEDIQWKSLTLRSMRGTPIRPDLVGTDSKCNVIIVEVKLKFDFHEKSNPRANREKVSIGQILQYACAYRRKCPSAPMPRLFIVSVDLSQDVREICQLLQEKGFDIRYLTIENILSEKEVSA